MSLRVNGEFGLNCRRVGEGSGLYSYYNHQPNSVVSFKRRVFEGTFGD